MLDPGCFLAIIKRKEMMQFDSLFMIKVAESKDLFGISKVQQQSKHEIILNRAVQTSQSSTRKRAKRIKVINYFNYEILFIYIFLIKLFIE